MSLVPQTNYGIYTSYYWDYGLRGVPIAGPPGTPQEVIAEHAPTCHKIVNWLAQAQDSENPQPPHWNTQNDNEVLVHKAISAPFLWDIGDGTVLTTVAGVYVYLLRIPPSDVDVLGMSAPPWDQSLMCVIAPSTFAQALLKGTNVDPTGGYAGMQGQNVTLFTKPSSGGTTSLTGASIAIGNNS